MWPCSFKQLFYLGLIASRGNAAMVYEGKQTVAVMAGDELDWNADAVEVCVTWATSNLEEKRKWDKYQLKYNAIKNITN